MECKQERNNCKQFIGTHKLRCQTDTKNNSHNNLPYERSQHNIKSKTVEGHKCKKCQEKAKNKENHKDSFNEKETIKLTQQTHKKKEINIFNTSEPSEATKFKEKMNKSGFKMEKRKKKGANMTVYGETNGVNTNRHISTNNRKQNHKHLKVTFSDQSESSSFKQNKKSGMETPRIRQKKVLHKVSNNNKIMNLDSKLFIKEGEMQKLKNCDKQDQSVAVEVQAESSTFSTSTNHSNKGIHSYRDEMKIIKHNINLITYPVINIRSVEENMNNIIDIYETRDKLNNEKPGGPVGDAENHKCQPLHEMEDITKHKNVNEKEYLLAETGSLSEGLISMGMMQNENQGENLYNQEIKEKSKFSNTFNKDTRRVEKEKKNLKKSGLKPPDNVTLSCDIYENSIDGRTPKSQRSLSDSCLKLKMKMYKYKSRKNKTLSIKHSTRNLSNKKQSKSLQNIKQNNLCNRSPELKQRNKSKPHELTNISASKNSAIEPENTGNDCELDKFKIINTYEKNNSNNLSISGSLNKVNQEEMVANEDQWCFADPGLYSCDSELILDDGERTANGSAPVQKFISPENSNESWSNEKNSKTSISVFEIDSFASFDNFSGTNNTMERLNSKETEPSIHINTIQNEYNQINSKTNENYYKNECYNSDSIIDSSNINVENDMGKRLIHTFPHQSAVTLISGFGSKCSLDNKKKSEGDLNKLHSSLKNIDISITIKKDAAVSASTSYEILRKTKFLTDKAIMCYEGVPSKVKRQRREKLTKFHHNHHRETRHICDTLLGKQDAIHHSGCIAVPEILNQGDNETIGKNVSQHRKYKGIYSEKNQTERINKNHNISNKEILQNKEENKTNTYIRQEELEDVKMKFKDNFTIVYNKENLRPRQPKGFWNTLRTGGRRIIRFLQDSASFKYCFKKE